MAQFHEHTLFIQLKRTGDPARVSKSTGAPGEKNTDGRKN